MKLKFPIKVLLCVLPFLILNFLFMLTEFDDNGKYVKKMLNVPSKIQLANTGSSHTLFGIDYSSYPELVTFNFALPAQVMIYDYKVINEFKKNFAENAVLLISIDYSMFDLTVKESAFNGMKDRYLRFLSKENLDDMTFNEYVKHKYFPILTALHPFKKIIRHFSLKNTGDDDGDLSSIPAELQAKAIYDSLERWKLNYDFESKKTNGGFEYNYKIASDMVKLCHENDIIPVFLTVPEPDFLNEIFENQEGFEDIQTVFDSFKEKLLSENQNVYWLDYSHDPEFSTNYSYYMDGDHINKRGAKIFTKKIVNDLKSLGLLK